MSATEKKDLPIIKQQVQSAVDFIYGGYENSIQDGYMKPFEMPSAADLIDEIYAEMQSCSFFPGTQTSPAQNQILDCDERVLKGLICLDLLGVDFFQGV